MRVAVRTFYKGDFWINGAREINLEKNHNGGTYTNLASESGAHLPPSTTRHIMLSATGSNIKIELENHTPVQIK